MSSPEPIDTATTRRQDLSEADQQELLAFIEKRNWFEGKLESLKTLAPVYPFVHPVLVPDPTSTAGYVRAGAEASPWRLPDKARLAAWINERNALEDEVERFDDGDMERMKQKTRQMTRVPLTQPSTDLVEVTLDLILLIDQLLQVLRRRGSILELTALRLQWDDLRYEMIRETESVKADIEHVVNQAQAWLPGSGQPREVAKHRESCENAPTPPASSAASSSDQARGIPRSTSGSSTISVGSTTSTSSKSPTKPHNIPRSALHISILRSQLVGLQTRHQNLQSNLVKRSGTILDGMIDQAGRLKDLGGVEGPVHEEGENKHAVPDVYIDLQEELESSARDIGERVKWCSSFEAQCRLGHEHFTASARAARAATNLLADLTQALAEPASSLQHSKLAQKYADACAALPAHVDKFDLPMPSHPAFPAKDEHNTAIVEALADARAEAEAEIELAGKVLAYYSAILKSRDALHAQQTRVQALRVQLRQAIQQLEHGSGAAPRPALKDVAAHGGNHTEWLRNIPTWLDDGDVAVHAATDTQAATTLAVMQYRKSFAGATMAVKPHLPPGGVPDDLGALVDDDAQDIVILAQRCAQLSKDARSDAEAVPLLLAVRQETNALTADVASLHRDVVRAVNQAAWSSRGEPGSNADLDHELWAILERVDDCSRDIKRLGGIPSASEPTSALSSALDGNRKEISTVRRDLDVLHRVSKQAETVRGLQAEAEALVRDMDAAEGAMGDLSAGARAAKLAELKTRVSEWNDSIARRVSFVSGVAPAAHTSPAANGGPLTPPLTPVGGEHEALALGTTMPDLSVLDTRVRSEVNRQSTLVSASLSQLATSHDTLAFNEWAAPVKAATDALESAGRELERLLAGLAKPSETKAESLEKLRTDSTALGKQAATVQTLVTNLNHVLGGDASSGLDMRRAADVFSTVDVAREVALAQVTAAQRWQEKFDDVSKKPRESKTTPARKAPQDDAQIKALAASLDALKLEAIVHPSAAQLRTSPKARRLPSPEDAAKLCKTFGTLSERARAMARSHPESSEAQRLVDKVTSMGGLIPELEALAGVSKAATQCDAAFSRLLDASDQAQADATEMAKKEAETAVATLETAADPLMRDVRVAKERQRVVGAWTELRSVVEDESVTPSVASTADADAVSTPRGAKPRPRTSLSSSLRSSPSKHAAANTPTKASTSRQRIASDTTHPRAPPRQRAPLAAESFVRPTTPRARPVSSLSPSKPTPLPSTTRLSRFTNTPGTPTTSRAARSVSVSKASDTSTTPKSTPRRPRASAPLWTSTPIQAETVPAVLSPKPDRSQSRLDAAVARVLNRLEVQVPMVAAGIPVSKDGKWRDESGRYWIGTGPRARMCFCRVLRSRTVMVRVGGGWIELSRYLWEHFGEHVEDEGGEYEWNSVPVTMTSSLLRPAGVAGTAGGAATAASSPRRAPFSPGTASAPRTPRSSLPPTFQSPAPSSVPPNTAAALRAASLSPEKGSPLVSLQYIRKASESPSMRDLEREALRRSGARSPTLAASAGHALSRERSRDSRTSLARDAAANPDPVDPESADSPATKPDAIPA